MTYKSDLFSRLQFLDSAVGMEESIDSGIGTTPHNGRANLIRKGLGIVAFNILEDFIKGVYRESLRNIATSGIGFELLPESLKVASTIDALGALKTHASRTKRDGGDWLGLIGDESLKIHSTVGEQFALSNFSLLSISSNVSSEDVSDLLKAFGISGGWGVLQNISNSINGGIPSLVDSYKNAALRRHGAAHEAGFNYEHRWLSQIKDEILAIASSIDIALSARCRQVRSDINKPVIEHDIYVGLNYRFLEESGNILRETIQVSGRSRKNWTERNLALARIKPMLEAKDEFLVTLDARKRIKDWEI